MRKLQLSVLLILAACSATDPANPTDPDDPAIAVQAESQVGEPFTLAPRQEQRIPAIGLVVRFADVATDQRCPRDVTSVWEGDAEVVVTVVQDGDERTFHLHTPRDVIGPTAAELRSGHRLELLALEPEPVSDRDTPLDEYRATFRVVAP